MRKSFLLSVIFCLLYFSTFINVNAQFTAVRCSRATIESYPEEQKRPVLQYMDEARQSADEFMQLLSEGKIDEIYGLNKRLSIWVQESPAVKVNLAAFEEREGNVTSFEYHSQDTIWYLNDYLLHLGGTVGTWYAVKTTKTKGEGIPMLVETNKGGNAQKSVLASVFYKPEIPKWQDNKVRLPTERGDCPSYKGTLSVKAE